MALVISSNGWAKSMDGDEFRKYMMNCMMQKCWHAHCLIDHTMIDRIPTEYFIIDHEEYGCVLYDDGSYYLYSNVEYDLDAISVSKYEEKDMSTQWTGFNTDFYTDEEKTMTVTFPNKVPAAVAYTYMVNRGFYPERYVMGSGKL